MRPSEDYGNHLNSEGKPMCKLCRNNYGFIPTRTFAAENSACPHCNRIKAILADIMISRIQRFKELETA